MPGPAWREGERSTDLGELAARLRALPPSCGPVRLVAVDGHAGSGKSTFAGRLAEALGGAPVLGLDQLAHHGSYFGWTDRLREQVLRPLLRGEEARYEVYDWRARAFTHRARLPVSEVVLVEGVGAGRRALREWLACVLWMDRDARSSWDRGRARDGAEQREFWASWVPRERQHFAEDPSEPFARLRVRESPEGYLWRVGPVGQGAPQQCHAE
ncbi:hypothetical protein [Streptomyces sp. NPDC005438]|uniref:uridine kinase family protein n=1 Tax=Streptomyces sp. NPDC005438 TaxID=3156880 RepID=UPI0033A6CE8D